MNYTYATTITTSSTFTRTTARYVTSKVTTDLQQLQRWYGAPSADDIDGYGAELVTMLAGRYMISVEYGFRRDGRWLVSLRYEVRSDGSLDTDSRAGGVPRGHDVTGAHFHSFMRWSVEWSRLTEAEQQAIYSPLPFTRTPGSEPGYALGVFTYDRAYSASGSGVARRTFKPL